MGKNTVKMKKQLIDISAVIRHETDNAYLLFDGTMETKKGDTTPSEKRTWVPKSMVENNEAETFTMPEWLALDKGFI